MVLTYIFLLFYFSVMGQLTSYSHKTQIQEVEQSYLLEWDLRYSYFFKQ